MRFLSIVIILATFIDIQKVTAATCADAERTRTIARDFKFSSDDPTLDYKACDSKNLGYTTAKAIAYLQDVSLKSWVGLLNQHSPLKNGPYKYFIERAQKISFQKICPHNGTAAAQVFPDVPSRKGIVYICPNAIVSGNLKSIISLASLLIHEARHFDGAQFNHVVCERGWKVGYESCDPTLDHQGSYGIQTSFLLGLSILETAQKNVKSLAQELALTNLMDKFNTPPAPLKRGALVQFKSGNVMFFDGETTKVVFKTSSDSVVFPFPSIPTSFDFNIKKVVSYRYHPELLTEEVAYSETFAPILASTEVPVDFISGRDYNCFLYRTGLSCWNFLGESQSMTLESYEALGLYLKPVVGKNYLRQQFISGSDGYLHKIPSDFETFKKSTSANLERIINPKFYTNIIVWKDNSDLLLNNEGVLSKCSRDQKICEDIHLSGILPGDHILKIVSDYVWSPGLENFSILATDLFSSSTSRY